MKICSEHFCDFGGTSKQIQKIELICLTVVPADNDSKRRNSKLLLIHWHNINLSETCTKKPFLFTFSFLRHRERSCLLHCGDKPPDKLDKKIR